MAERFIRLFELPNDLYSINSPIIIRQAVLLNDTKSENVIAQIKFQSVSNKAISAVKVNIVAIDVTGKEINDVISYSYLDLNVDNGQEFGSNRAIIFPSIATRSFRLQKITAIYLDKTITEIQMPLQPLQEKVPLLDALKDYELVKQYQISVNPSAKFVPQEDSNLWHCSCGRWNKGKACTQCNASKQDVFTAYDLEKLIGQRDVRLQEEERLRKEKEHIKEIARCKKEEQKAIAIKRTKHVAKVIVPVIAIVLFCTFLYSYWILPTFIRPSQSYSTGISLMNEQKYDEAASIFESLGTYKDSETMKNEALYCNANVLCDNKKYKDAIELYRKIGDYKDGPQKLKQTQYQLANQLFGNDNFAAAKELYETLSNYKDSEKRLLDCDYFIALNLIKTKDYLSALDSFKALGNYKDAVDLVKECSYLAGKDYIKKGQYKDAVQVFNLIGDYKDSKDYVLLLDNAVSMVFSGQSELMLSAEYYWIVSEIDTDNCTSKLILYSGRADSSGETIDITFNENEQMDKCWKINNGTAYMTEKGEDPSLNGACYRVWNISGNWESFTEKVYNNDGSELGDPGEYDSTWTRADNQLSEKIMQSFIAYFQKDERWSEPYYTPAKAILDYKNNS